MREMVWVAQHADGRILKEFEFKRGRWVERSFYDIKKDRLVSFGLEGSNLRVGFLTSDGIISVYGTSLEVALAKDMRIYPITGRKDIVYNDIIQYKDAEASIGIGKNGKLSSRITQYNMGYKCSGRDEDLGKWHYQVVVHIPTDESKLLYCTFRLVIEEGFSGKFLIRWGKVQRAVDTILRPRTANMLNMTFRS